jgi:hypothetical protein
VVGADEVGALTDRFAREPHRLVIIASNELGTGYQTSDDRGERVARAQSQRAAGRDDALLQSSAFRHRD